MTTYSVIYHTDSVRRPQNRSASATHHVQRMRKRKEAKRQFTVAMILFFMVLLVIVVGNFLRTSQVKASSAKEETVYYKTVEVEEGDTLWDLADRYMGEKSFSHREYIKQVKELNHLSGDTIESGAYLMVPYVEVTSEL